MHVDQRGREKVGERVEDQAKVPTKSRPFKRVHRNPTEKQVGAGQGVTEAGRKRVASALENMDMDIDNKKKPKAGGSGGEGDSSVEKAGLAFQSCGDQ